MPKKQQNQPPPAKRKAKKSEPKKPAKSLTKSAQSTQPNKKEQLMPKQAEIENQKKDFIEALKIDGIVSNALETANLPRKTAYEHFAKDAEFAALWLEALDAANDSLIKEARTRAVGSQGSDTLLIYLLNQAERQQKWRSRIIQTGNLAFEAVVEFGKERNWSPEQTDLLIQKMKVKFEKVKLV